MNIITEADRYVFGQGNHYEIYNKLGAHLMEIDGEQGAYFAVWAPNAQTVSVVGEFNNWCGFDHNMTPLGTSGIWEIFIPGMKQWDMYKYVIVAKDGSVYYKADPYAFHSELRPGTASKVVDIDHYTWNDSAWLDKASSADQLTSPMSIYEVHIGSWKKNFDLNEDGFYDYRTLAHDLANYVKDMGYTHIELMGIAEHPFDGSWGYQVTSYFAPTARYGAPEDFMYFVDYMHQNGIGVILDWVPAHFPKDAHGLAMFDGTPLYEYPDPRMGEHPDWGTKIFNYGKNEVSNFLIANALFWIEKYHVDALRVDAVASMLYLDYGKQDGQWVPNEFGENRNLEAIEFFRHLSSIIKRRNPRAMVIAEESTAWPGVTQAPEEGGLGFNLKWNMGWMNDFLEYVKCDPLFKKGNHNKITFSLTYAFSENYILVISHDEVVHLKCSMLKKMPGYPNDKFANLKGAYTFMFGHPGRKLLFMGQEFAQLSEWAEDKNLEWHLLQEPLHKDMQQYVKKLLHLYKDEEVLHCFDNDYRSFQWINCNDSDRSIFSFIRKHPDTYDNGLLFIVNFTPIERSDYTVGVPQGGTYETVLSSYVQATEDGNIIETETTSSYTAKKEECDELEYRLEIPLKPLQALVIRIPQELKPVEEEQETAQTFETKNETEVKLDANKAVTSAPKAKAPASGAPMANAPKAAANTVSPSLSPFSKGNKKKSKGNNKKRNGKRNKR